MIIIFDLMGIAASAISFGLGMYFYRAHEGRYRAGMKYFAAACSMMLIAFTADLLISRLDLIAPGPVDMHHLFMTIGTICYLLSIRQLSDIGEGFFELFRRESLERARIKQELDHIIVRHETATDLTDIAVYDWNSAAGHIEWNSKARKILGEQLAVLKGPVAIDPALINRPGGASVSESFKRTIEAREEYWKSEYVFTNGGKDYTVIDRAKITYDREGRPARVIGAIEDGSEVINLRGTMKAINDELSQMSRLMVSRENDMNKLKEEVNKYKGTGGKAA